MRRWKTFIIQQLGEIPLWRCLSRIWRVEGAKGRGEVGGGEEGGREKTADRKGYAREITINKLIVVRGRGPIIHFFLSLSLKNILCLYRKVSRERDEV